MLSKQKINRQKRPKKSKPNETQPNPLVILNSRSLLAFDLLVFHARRCMGRNTLNQRSTSKEPDEAKSKDSSDHCKGLIKPKTSHPPKKKRNGNIGLPLRVCGLEAPQCGQVFPGRLTPSYSITAPHFSHGSFQPFLSSITSTPIKRRQGNPFLPSELCLPSLPGSKPCLFFRFGSVNS